MGASRGRKQVALVAGLLGALCLAFLGFLIAAGAMNTARAWPLLAVSAVAMVASAFYIFGQGSLPSSEDVATVAEHIAAVRDRGVGEGQESHKGKLRFYLPADWRYQKIGKEGWLICPKGLGAPLTISIWAFDADPAFQDASTQGLAWNAQDLSRRQGFVLVDASVRECGIAGQNGISYRLRRGRRECAQGYLWKYEGGDYQVVIEASSQAHLVLVRPAIDEFLRGLFMW